jgi:hypothetical protein
MTYCQITLDTGTVAFSGKRDCLVLAIFVLIFHCEIFNLIKSWVPLKCYGTPESSNKYYFVVFN